MGNFVRFIWRKWMDFLLYIFYVNGAMKMYLRYVYVDTYNLSKKGGS